MKQLQKFFAVLSLLFLTVAAHGQEKATKNFSVEAFGAHNTIGLNYDFRLRGNEGLGFRFGLGYTYSTRNHVMRYFYKSISGVASPFEVNYLFGKKNHKLELGLGGSVGYYHEKHTESVMDKDTPTDYYITSSGERVDIPSSHIENARRNVFGFFLFENIGYRYQPTSGVVFRTGVTHSYSLGSYYGMSRPKFYPYVGVGISF